MKILIVEDVVLIADYIREILTINNIHDIWHATEGNDAIRKVLEYDPDIVLMDIKIDGDIDGIETSRILRSKGYKKPIIFVTAYSDEETIKNISDISFSTYILKPVDETKLITTIRNTLSVKHPLV